MPGKSLPKLITTNNTPAASRANTLTNSRKAYSKATFNSGHVINQIENEMLFKQTPEERFAKRLFEDHSQNIFNDHQTTRINPLLTNFGSLMRKNISQFNDFKNLDNQTSHSLNFRDIIYSVSQFNSY